MGPRAHQSGELVDLKNVCKLHMPAGLRGLSDINKMSAPLLPPSDFHTAFLYD